LKHIYNAIVACVILAKKQHIKGRFRIAYNYFILRLKCALSTHRPSGTLITTRFLSYKIQHYSLQRLAYLIEEIFVNQIYNFESDKQSPVIVDCGGNIGVSVIFFKWLYPKSQITVFEADPEAYKALVANIRINNFEHVRPIQSAVSNVVGSMQFYASSMATGSLSSSLLSARGGDKVITVSTDILSNYIHKPVDFLKMDIEGAEFSVLKEIDMAGKMSLFHKFSIEYHHNISNNCSLSDFVALFDKNKIRFIAQSAINAEATKSGVQDIVFTSI
jgi:FkbM family methyltransferase